VPRPEPEPLPDAESDAEATADAAAGGSRRSGPRARRPPSPKPIPVVPVLAGFGVVVVGLVVFLIVRGRGSDARPAAPPTASASAPAADPAEAAAKKEPAAPAPAPEPVKPVVAAPPQKPPPSLAEVIQRIEKATTAEEAAEVARDAERTKDSKLVEQCWTKVLKLDPNHEDARAKLGVEALDPMKDLPGFAAIAATPQRVHLKPFREAARGELTKSDRAALLADWDAARKEIDARVEKAKTQPYYAQVDQLRIDLADKKFFSTLEYEMVESKPPYALFIEVKGTPEERRKRRAEAEASYTPFLEAYDRKIHSYLVPLAPKPPSQEPLFPVFVFLNFDRYNDYSVADSGEKSPPGRRAHYEPGKKQCFTYSPVLKVGYGAFTEGTQSLLHELTHAWVDQLASPDGGATRGIHCLKSHWFSEGIAEFMSCQFLDRGEVRFEPWRSNRVSGAFRPPGWRIPMTKALEIPLHGLDLWAQLQIQSLDVKKREEALVTISAGFYADMSNFILWLNLKSGAGRPRQFEAYAREEMAGNGGIESFQRCFPKLLDEVKDLDKTIDDFVLHIANGKINPYQEYESSNEGASASKK
jgi:hypothetical protein